MSRIGKKPAKLPNGVKVTVEGDNVLEGSEEGLSAAHPAPAQGQEQQQ